MTKDALRGLVVILGGFAVSCALVVPAYAAVSRIDYGTGPVVDSDLDGLTDRGETDIFTTNPQRKDTDGDGWVDGAEVIAGTDPLGADPVPVVTVAAEDDGATATVHREVPWPWYVARGSGLAAFVLLWVAMFMVLAIRSPLTKDLVPGVYKLSLHINITVMAFLWTVLHGASFLFDHFLNFSIGDVVIPFFGDHGHVISQTHLALGILASWAMVILMITGFLRQRLPYVVFRSLHFINVFVFIAVFFHASVLGTDLRAHAWLMTVFLVMNGLLAIVWISTLWAMLQTFRAQRLARDRAAAAPAATAPPTTPAQS